MAALTLLDAYALVAYLLDEPAAEEVGEILAAPGATASSVNVAEAADVASRVHGADRSDVHEAVELLVDAGLLTVSAPDLGVALRAAGLRAAYYGRRARPISLADCFLLAAATPADRIATADPSAADVARAEGLGVLALPDCSGHRP